ncbi:CCA tRNA nucleotidyltransferase [Rhizorhabdus sp.]|jgi:poly(A) polymerase|uniref:CCA tRNA nucleotidyltransferase n=1 Tax=Rhizorhabdus sp. TaxID=1968843 RepID=UPI0035B0DB49
MTRLPDSGWRRAEGMDRLMEALGAKNGMIRFVGGAVRDSLLGLPVKDVDCATRWRPEQSIDHIVAAGFKAIPTGLAHGTVTALLPSGPVEVTTLRRDLSTDGRHATVAFTDEWREDAARRDFTINALSADPLTGELFDYFGGLDDLHAGRVRFIGDPLQRIAEDHLRIMRFFRFHERFGHGDPDPDAMSACVARANDLMALSRERIADELLKLLGGANPAPTIRLMFDNGIFRPIIPEIDSNGVDNLSRLVPREGQSGTLPDGLRRLGALLPASPEIAVSIARRLKLSKAATRRLELSASGDSGPAHRLAYRYGNEVATDLLLRGDCDIESLDAAALTAWERPRLPLGGGELIAMGLRPGPVVAATLQQVERQWVEEGFPDGERVSVLAREAVDQALRSRQ